MRDKIWHAGKSGNGQEIYVFQCPGCEYGHNVEVPRWEWNGSFSRPTFYPSVFVFKDDPERMCHSHILNGTIMFLNDCFHELSGQTVDLPDNED